MAAGGPLVVLLAGRSLPFTEHPASVPLAAWSPATALWSLTAAGFEPPTPAEWRLAGTGLGIALAAWIALGAARLVRRGAADP